LLTTLHLNTLEPLALAVIYFVTAVQINPADLGHSTATVFETGLKCRHHAFSIASLAAVPVALTD